MDYYINLNKLLSNFIKASTSFTNFSTLPPPTSGAGRGSQEKFPPLPASASGAGSGSVEKCLS